MKVKNKIYGFFEASSEELLAPEKRVRGIELIKDKLKNENNKLSEFLCLNDDISEKTNSYD